MGRVEQSSGHNILSYSDPANLLMIYFISLVREVKVLCSLLMSVIKINHYFCMQRYTGKKAGDKSDKASTSKD